VFAKESVAQAPVIALPYVDLWGITCA